MRKNEFFILLSVLIMSTTLCGCSLIKFDKTDSSTNTSDDNQVVFGEDDSLHYETKSDTVWDTVVDEENILSIDVFLPNTTASFKIPNWESLATEHCVITKSDDRSKIIAFAATETYYDDPINCLNEAVGFLSDETVDFVKIGNAECEELEEYILNGIPVKKYNGTIECQNQSVTFYGYVSEIDGVQYAALAIGSEGKIDSVAEMVQEMMNQLSNGPTDALNMTGDNFTD